jgi:hypothetical protein
MNLFNILDQITPKGTYFGLKLSKLLSLVNPKFIFKQFIHMHQS